MPTAKKRINLSVEDKLFKSLALVSKKRGEPIASVSLQLIRGALDLDEDFYFSKSADARFEKEKNLPTYSHADAWG